MTKPTRLQAVAFRDYRHVRGSFGNQYRETRADTGAKPGGSPQNAKYVFGAAYRDTNRDGRAEFARELKQPCWRCDCGAEIDCNDDFCRRCGSTEPGEYR